jgi:tetratricopeptide (TPR) repeat protein
VSDLATQHDSGRAHALAQLGRVRVLAGRWQEGERLLHEAVELAADPEEAAFAHALIAEARVMAGRSAEALELAELIPTTRRAALVHRVRGLALAQLGRRQEAEQALQAALADARATSDDLEAAQALDALCRINALGADRLALVRERDALLRRLGLPSLPLPPLAIFPA